MMPEPAPRSAETLRDPSYYLLRGAMALNAVFLAWALTPWFPWK